MTAVPETATIILLQTKTKEYRKKATNKTNMTSVYKQFQVTVIRNVFVYLMNTDCFIIKHNCFVLGKNIENNNNRYCWLS